MFPHVHVIGATTKAFEFGVRHTVEAVFSLRRMPRDVELVIRVLPLPAMRALNASHRGVDRPTDFLTFPGSGSSHAIDAALNHSLFASLSPDDDPAVALREARDELVDLGDIFVCPEYMALQVRRFPHRNLSLPRYTSAGLVHALLHSMGYEHSSLAGHRRMVREEKALGSFLRNWHRRRNAQAGPLMLRT